MTTIYIIIAYGFFTKTALLGSYTTLASCEQAIEVVARPFGTFPKCVILGNPGNRYHR